MCRGTAGGQSGRCSVAQSKRVVDVVAVSGGSLPGGAVDSGQGGALESLECHATCLKSAQAITRNTTLGVCVCVSNRRLFLTVLDPGGPRRCESSLLRAVFSCTFP